MIWERLEKMGDEDIDLSDCPEVTPEMFAKAIAKRGGIPITKAKAQVTLRIDRDVLDWFKAKGQGYRSNTESATWSR